MLKREKMTYVVIAYVVIFSVFTVGTWVWHIKRRRQRPPIQFKFLRGPGESLRRRVAKFDENGLFYLAGAALAPPTISIPVIISFQDVWEITTWERFYIRAGIAAALFIGSLVLSLRWLFARLDRWRSDYLGYLGERAVGEALAPLAGNGYHVFHDIPAVAGKKRFNIDHAVVGPTGLFAIETKTRRKGRAREGYEEHKVAYDGRRLDWPWGYDDFGLRQAEARAKWLSEELDKIPRFGLVAKPVLALPGWYVVPKGFGPVAVLNQKQLVGAIMKSNGQNLTQDQIDTLARQLDAKCRDVED